MLSLCQSLVTILTATLGQYGIRTALESFSKVKDGCKLKCWHLKLSSEIHPVPCSIVYFALWKMRYLEWQSFEILSGGLGESLFQTGFIILPPSPCPIQVASLLFPWPVNGNRGPPVSYLVSSHHIPCPSFSESTTDAYLPASVCAKLMAWNVSP